jgi:dTDP-4-dehydrorhamnose 3,5-epimerase-like enzyme
MPYTIRTSSVNKFVDARGWSLNDIYSMMQHIRQPLTGLEMKASDFQINYSILYPGIYKAWHRHQNQDDYFCVLKGMAQVGIINKEGKAKKYFLGEHNPMVLHIEAGEWHGLTALGNEPCGLLYLVTKRYDHHAPDEERLPYTEFVGHDWWLPENK